MSSLALAEVLAARDASTKVDALLALLECLEEIDSIDHADLARTIQPVDFLRDAILGRLEIRNEEHETLAQSESGLEEELDKARERIAELEKPEHAHAVLELEKRLAETEARLDAAMQTIAAYSDMLAMARKFVACAEGAGLKTRHARPTPKKKGTVP